MVLYKFQIRESPWISSLKFHVVHGASWMKTLIAGRVAIFCNASTSPLLCALLRWNYKLRTFEVLYISNCLTQLQNVFLHCLVTFLDSVRDRDQYSSIFQRKSGLPCLKGTRFPDRLRWYTVEGPSFASTVQINVEISVPSSRCQIQLAIWVRITSYLVAQLCKSSCTVLWRCKQVENNSSWKLHKARKTSYSAPFLRLCKLLMTSVVGKAIYNQSGGMICQKLSNVSARKAYFQVWRLFCLFQ